MLLRIKRIERNASWGVKDPSTGKYKPKFENCVDRWQPGLNKTNGMLRTGLTKEEANLIESEMGYDKGYLSPNGEYWKMFQIVIPDVGLTLDLDSDDIKKTQDFNTFIQYKALMNCPLVAKDINEAKTNGLAEYVITTDRAEAESKNSRRQVITDAFATYAKMTNTTIQEALYMFGKSPEGMDPEVCKDELGQIVENDPKRFLSVVGDPNFKDKIWVIKLIRGGILKKSGVGVGFDMTIMFGDIILGKGLDEVIAFIKDKENQNIYIGLKKAFEASNK